MKKIKTPYRGVRYRIIDDGGMKVKSFFIRYQIDGRSHEFALGTSPAWTAKLAMLERNKYMLNVKTGIGPKSPRDEKQAQKTEETKTFGYIANNVFLPSRTAEQQKDERIKLDLWILPEIGSRQLAEITVSDLEQIKFNMESVKDQEGNPKPRAPETIRKVIFLVRQIMRYAQDHDLYNGRIPRLKIKVGDNKRQRYLTQEQAHELLNRLKEKSETVYEISLFSLITGCRHDEIVSLTWGDLDLDAATPTAFLWDTKNKSSLPVKLDKRLVAMLKAKTPGQKNDLIWKSETGEKIKQVSNTFMRVVDDMGLNDGVTDRRQKFTFHCLRHSAASFLINKGIPLYEVGKHLRHRTLISTQRYSHLADSVTDKTTQILSEILD